MELAHERGRRVHDRLGSGGGAGSSRSTGSDGRRVDYRYDDAGRLVAAARPGRCRARYEHDEAGRVASVTDADGVVELVNTYDADGRVLTQRSPFGRLVTFGYQPDGVTVVADDSAGPRNTYRHDAAGRLLAATDGHGHTQHTRYDRWGNPVEIVRAGRGGDPPGVRRARAPGPPRRCPPARCYDDHAGTTPTGSPRVTITGPDDPAGHDPATRYDGAERVPVGDRRPGGRGHPARRWPTGWCTTVTDPDGVTAAVRPRRRRQPRRGRRRGRRDGPHRARRRRPADRGGHARPGGAPSWRTTRRGRLVRAARPGRRGLGFEYSRGRPADARSSTRPGRAPRPATARTARPSSWSTPLGAVTTRRYDSFGNLAGGRPTRTGAKWDYAYDALSRLTAWTDPAGGTWLREYDVDGRPTAAVDPTGVRDGYAYDADGPARPAPTTAWSPTGSATTSWAGPTAEIRGRRRAPGSVELRPLRPADRPITDAGRRRQPATTTARPGGCARIVRPAGRERAVRLRRGCGRPGHPDRRQRRRQWRCRYDPDGLLVERITPTGLAETFERDPAGRVTRHRMPGRGTSSYAYDPARAGRRDHRPGRAPPVHPRRRRPARRRHRRARPHHPLHLRRPRPADRHHRPARWHAPNAATTSSAGSPARPTRSAAAPGTGYDAAGRPTRTARPDRGPAARRLRPVGPARPASPRRRPPTVLDPGASQRDALGRPVRHHRDRRRRGRAELGRGDRLVERRTAAGAIGWSLRRRRPAHAALHPPDGTRGRLHRDDAGGPPRRAGRIRCWAPVRLRRDADGRLLGDASATAARTRWTYTDGWLDRPAPARTASGGRRPRG